MKKLLVIVALFVSGVTIAQEFKHRETYTFTKQDIRHADSLRTHGIDWNGVYSEFVVLLNAYRKQHNLDTLVWNDAAFKASEYMSNYCFTNNVLTHETTNPGFETFTNRCAKFNLNSKAIAGECGLYTPLWIMYCRRTHSIAQLMLDSWIESKSHNSILLKKDVKYVGICSNLRNDKKSFYAFLVVY